MLFRKLSVSFAAVYYLFFVVVVFVVVVALSNWGRYNS